MAQDGADGLGDVGGREHGQRHLIKQRLKEVVIAPVDQRHIDGQVRETFGRVETGEASADDDYAGTARRRLLVIGRIGEFTQWRTSLLKRCARGSTRHRIQEKNRREVRGLR